MSDKSKKRTRYIVLKDGVACGFIHRNDFKSKARGVLATMPDRPHYFSSEDAANHAIEGTLEVIRLVKGSLLEGWPKLSHLMEPGKFTTERKRS